MRNSNHFSQRYDRSCLCRTIPAWALLVWLVAIPSAGQAQVTTNITPTAGVGNLGTTVTQNGNVYGIGGGTRPGNGANLFHSLNQFSVGAADIARFQTATLNPDATVSNILSRVTGGNPSSIFGTVDSMTFYPNANLFLMNPAGIVFGGNATLNVGGSVHFTTADNIAFADGTKFHAVPNAAGDILSAAPVTAFGFLTADAASIAIQGSTLGVQNGKTLSFTGGLRDFLTEGGATVPSGVTMTAGHLSAPDGLIHMETVTTPGDVALPMLSGNPLGAPTTFAGSGNAVIRIQGGELVMKGASLRTTNAGPTTGEPIGVAVELGGQFTMQNLSSLSSSTTGEGKGGAINVGASALAMDASSITSTTSGEGAGGKVTARVGELDLTNGAQIVSRSDGPKVGGQLDIVATNHITLNGIDSTGTLPGVLSVFGSVPSGLMTVSTSTGNGGELTLTAPTVNVRDGAHIGSFGSGDGAGGNITLNVGRLNVEGGGQVWSSSGVDLTTFAEGSGAGGRININATKEILVSGGDPFQFGPSQISSNAFGVGEGGPINLTAQTVQLEDGGAVASNGYVGMNGAINVQANDVSISGFLDLFGFPLPGGIMSSSAVPSGGAISVTASSVNVDRGSISNTGGSVALTVDSLNVTGGGDVSVLGSGALTITATDSVMVSGQVPGSRSRIQNIAAGDAQNGGISITQANTVSVTDGGRINLEIGNLPGGQITIEAESIAITGDGKIRMDVGEGGGGLVKLTADNVGLHQGGIQTVTKGNTAAGAIDINATTLALELNSLINSQTGEETTSGGQTGAAGPIHIAAQSVILSGDSKISSSSLTAGDAGSVTVNAVNLVSLTGSGTGILSEAKLIGKGGPINITTDTFAVSNGAAVSASTSGTSPSATGGSVTVKANEVQLNSGGTLLAKSTGPGKAGNITIEGAASPARSVTITDPGSGIFTDTAGTGAGGNIKVEANAFTLSNGGTLLASTSGTAPSATGGTITVTASQVQLNTGGVITAETTGQGKAGGITIDAAENFQSNGGVIHTTATQAEGGDIHITAGQDIVLSNTASMSASSAGSGDAGNITALAGDDFVMQNSSITTEAAQASGGNIKLGATDQVILQNSVVSASVLGSSGGGGDVNIDPNFVILQNSQVLAQAVQGPGGNIFITTNFFLADQNSLVDASSQFGVNGTVTIQSPANSLSGGIRPLPQGMLQAATLLHQRCAAQLNGQASSFVVAGRDALPPEPGTWLASAVLPEDQSDSAIEDGVLAEVEPVSETPFLSLRRMHGSGPFAYALPDEWARCGS